MIEVQREETGEEVLNNILKKKNKTLRNKIEILRKKNNFKIFIIVLLLISNTYFALQQANKVYVENLNDTLTQRVVDLEKEVLDLVEVTENQGSNITAMYSVMEELDTQNQSLITLKDNLNIEIEHYKGRAELYDRYEYAIVNEMGDRTDITYDNLKTLSELCEEYGVDMDLILSIIMVESRGRADAKNSDSTARGLGQILESTGEIIYEKLMGNEKGSYNHDMALDPMLNMEMIVVYMNHLQNEYNGNMTLCLKNYCGDQSETGNYVYTYIGKVDKYLTKANKSVSTLYQ